MKPLTSEFLLFKRDEQAKKKMSFLLLQTNEQKKRSSM